MDINSISNNVDIYRDDWMAQASETEQQQMSEEIQSTNLDPNTPMDSFSTEAPCSDAEAPPKF